MNKKQIAAVLLVTLSSSCATQTKSTLLGTGIGSGTGAILGSVMSNGKSGSVRTRNVILGTTIGALGGGLTGSLIHGNTEREKEASYQKGLADKQKDGGVPPRVRAPKVESFWVEGRATGNKYIDGHYEYLITEPTRWEEN